MLTTEKIHSEEFIREVYAKVSEFNDSDILDVFVSDSKIIANKNLAGIALEHPEISFAKAQDELICTRTRLLEETLTICFGIPHYFEGETKVVSCLIKMEPVPKSEDLFKTSFYCRSANGSPEDYSKGIVVSLNEQKIFTDSILTMDIALEMVTDFVATIHKFADAHFAKAFREKRYCKEQPVKPNAVEDYKGLSSIEKVNFFRNKYHAEGTNTEYGIVADALNDLLPKCTEGDKVSNAILRSVKELHTDFHDNSIFDIDGQKIPISEMIQHLEQGDALAKKFEDTFVSCLLTYFMKFGAEKED